MGTVSHAGLVAGEHDFHELLRVCCGAEKGVGQNGGRSFLDDAFEGRACGLLVFLHGLGLPAGCGIAVGKNDAALFNFSVDGCTRSGIQYVGNIQ